MAYVSGLFPAQLDIHYQLVHLLYRRSTVLTRLMIIDTAVTAGLFELWNPNDGSPKPQRGSRDRIPGRGYGRSSLKLKIPVPKIYVRIFVKTNLHNFNWSFSRSGHKICYFFIPERFHYVLFTKNFILTFLHIFATSFTLNCYRLLTLPEGVRISKTGTGPPAPQFQQCIYIEIERRAESEQCNT